MDRMSNYIKFSSRFDDKDYFTTIDLTLEAIKIQENGITVFDDKLRHFKRAVAKGGWLHNNIYENILTNGEELMNILTKA